MHQILPFELFLRAVWPPDRSKNRAKLYARITGAKLRTAKYRFSGKRDPDYMEIVAILRSEYGFDFLKHVMGDAAPSWWATVSRARNIGDMRRQQADLHRRIAQLEMQV